MHCCDLVLPLARGHVSVVLEGWAHLLWRRYRWIEAVTEDLLLGGRGEMLEGLHVAAVFAGSD